MENIGREPNTVHGTVHGPGYSGGSGIGGGHTLTEPLANDYHVYAIEWEPEQIRWYIDDTQYFTVTPSMLPQGTAWVFDHPFFLIMNVAVGGYWPGYPDETTQFPQTMHVDYVRVYQAPESAERFETTFNDAFTGWKQLSFPYETFTRSATQPANAPNDGLTLSEVWGYGLAMPSGSNGGFYLDAVRFATVPTHTIYLPVVMRSS
jgi:beta-glucanase (GH16 family)